MKDKLSIRQAIRKGWLTITLPTFLLINFPIVIAFLWRPETTDNGLLLTIYGSIWALGILLGILWHKYQSGKWRLWAFQNTPMNQWSALKKAAIKKQFISRKEKSLLLEHFLNSDELEHLVLVHQQIEDEEQFV